MQNPIEKEQEVFQFLLSKYCTKANQKDIINRAKAPLINKICECVLNILNGKVNISKDDVEKLKPYKKLFRKLLQKKLKLTQKKKLINQKGGFLQIILPLITAAIDLFSNLFNKNEASE
jgi:hypothetical protein